MVTDTAPVLLWRVVYNAQTNRVRNPWDAGPWHPDRARVEGFAVWLRGQGHDAQVQDNSRARISA